MQSCYAYTFVYIKYIKYKKIQCTPGTGLRSFCDCSERIVTKSLWSILNVSFQFSAPIGPLESISIWYNIHAYSTHTWLNIWFSIFPFVLCIKINSCRNKLSKIQIARKFYLHIYFLLSHSFIPISVIFFIFWLLLCSNLFSLLLTLNPCARFLTHRQWIWHQNTDLSF